MNAWSWVFVWVAACSGTEGGEPPAGTTRELTLAAYTTPREAYGKALLPGFAVAWAREHDGQTVEFRESYQGSGAQARAVVDGFEADVVALSLAPDIAVLEKAGLVQPTWDDGPTRGMVTTSYVVLAVRPGNPKGIQGWADLAKPGVEVLTPNVRTSGGAMWNVAALWGAAFRGGVDGVPAGDPAAAEAFLASVLKNVKVMDKGARESMVTFESGVGDVAITYENEVLVAKQAGKDLDYVVPSATILIENPIAVVDTYAEKHGNTDLAQAFVAWLTTPEAQASFASHGLRPVVGEAPADLPVVSAPFTVRDLGDWAAVTTTLFERDAVYDRATAGGR